MPFLIAYRDEDRAIRYYHGMNGQTGRAVVGSKIEAPRFDAEAGGGNPQATADTRQPRMADGAGRGSVSLRVSA